LTKRKLQTPAFPAALFDLRASAAVVIRPIAREIPSLDVNLPYGVAFIDGRQIEEECSQRETPSQFRRKTRDRIAGRDPQASALRDRIDDLKRCTQPFSRSTDQRTLHRGQIERHSRKARRRACR